MEADREPEKRKRRSGSEKRRTGKRFTFRMTPEEYTELTAAAEREGLTLGSFVRSRLLPVPRTRQRRRPSIEVEALAKLLASINRMGGNLNQLVKHQNFGETVLAHEVAEALAGYRDMVASVMAALGRAKP